MQGMFYNDPSQSNGVVRKYLKMGVGNRDFVANLHIAKMLKQSFCSKYPPDALQNYIVDLNK
jgi:hypothetical protein